MDRQRPRAARRRCLAAAAALAVLCAAGAAAPAAAAAGGDADMWAWLRRGGAVIAVEPGVSPGGVRGALATKDIPAGGLIASIPIPLTIHFKQPSGHADLLAVAEWLALEARNASSPHAPYLASLPMLTDVHHTLSYENFPPAYLHLLQDGGPLADHIVDKRAATLTYWAARGAGLLRAGVTLDALRAALITLTTRYFNGPSGTAALVPVYDLLNHVNGCQTQAGAEPCDPAGAAAGQQCLAVRTRAPVRAGAEVCNTYGWLAPDHMAFHYGFVHEWGAGAVNSTTTSSSSSSTSTSSSGGGAPELSRVDRAGFTRADMSKTDHAPPPRFNGTVQELEAERARLAARLDALLSAEPLAAAQVPDLDEDPRGDNLALVRAWRRQRAAALAAEVERLRTAAVAAAGEAGRGGGELLAGGVFGVGGGRDSGGRAASLGEL